MLAQSIVVQRSAKHTWNLRYQGERRQQAGDNYMFLISNHMAATRGGGHRQTACFHTPLVKPKRGPTARTCTRGRCTFRLPSRRWRWPDRSGRLVVWQIGHTVLACVERKIALGLQQLVLKARADPEIGQAHGRLQRDHLRNICSAKTGGSRYDYHPFVLYPARSRPTTS